MGLGGEARWLRGRLPRFQSGIVCGITGRGLTGCGKLCRIPRQYLAATGYVDERGRRDGGPPQIRSSTLTAIGSSCGRSRSTPETGSTKRTRKT